MSEIKNIYMNNKNIINEDMEKNNYEFYKYFTKKYLNYKDKRRKKIIRDGFILIRDPADTHYNPGQKFNYEDNLDIFIKRLRFAYSNLIMYGSLKISEKIKEKLEY